MANISFDGTELSALGLSVHAVDGRSMAAWVATRVEILGRYQMAEVGGGYAKDTRTQIAGQFAALTMPYSGFTRSNMLANWQTLKNLLDPELGYKKLVITGDGEMSYRWVRYTDGSFSENRPVFKLPAVPVSFSFDNLEPFWRLATNPINVTTALTTAIANEGKKTRPVITLTVGTTISAVAKVNLFAIDGYTFQWSIADGDPAQPKAGDKIAIDSENLTVMILKSGTGVWRDAVRAYTYSSPLNDGFPMIWAGALQISG